jgi:hypothetical protein
MTLPRLALAAVLLVSAGSAAAQAPGRCEVPAFRGVTQPGGATATMRVVNDGQPCRFGFRMTNDTGEAFATTRVLREPTGGSVTASGNGVAYLPRPGFTGADSFVIAMSGVAAGGAAEGRRIDGQITVTVTVVAR